MSETFVKYLCWQKERVSEVINREAVEMESAAFLATHTPLTGLTYEKSEYEISDRSENGLLQTLIERTVRDQHTFIVLKGIPGTGKSHLIRWLKESFDQHNRRGDGSEVILLIRRANSSLQSTIRQIIEADVFNTPVFNGYLERLRDANVHLTETQLTNRILNGLQEAAVAVREGTYQPLSDRAFSKRITNDAPWFLNDKTVRDQLLRRGGAVERISAFLAGADRKMGEGEEMPRFSAEDLDFPPEAVAELKRVNYAEVKRLTEYLVMGKHDVAVYLNSLLNFAVSNLTALTADQLTAMFGDLRRQLRREGKNLTLFVEDITAFTGLDAALMDVLIAQHGAENSEFCRLTALIGVTDAYYEQNFRDNVRQRVTFLISLNAREGSEDVSHLLQSPEIAVEMVARYLNAIRLQRVRVSEWYASGAQLASLPNACTDCPMRPQCHAAFGSVQIGTESGDAVGLYPFNAQAVWELYTHIDNQRTMRTPRALVNNILSYVLISHTDKIRTGQFPTPARELALDVVPGNLRKPTQRTVIEANAPNKLIAERLEALIRVWGDATIDTYEQDGQTFVGELPKAMFDAFTLPFFQGDFIAPPVPLPKTPEGTEKPKPPAPVGAPNADDIENWRNGGRLESYRLLAEDLAKFARAAIEWELYGITRTLVDERLVQARFEIEGQSGKMRPPVHITFPRTDEMALVLHTLDEMRAFKNPAPDQIATHAAVLHRWLAEWKDQLIAYVRKSGEDQSAPLDYEATLTQAAYGLALLNGNFVANDGHSARELFLRLVAFANGAETIASALGRSEGRSEDWRKALSAADSKTNDGDSVRRAYLTMLNCPQGTSQEITYLDAARGIQLMRELKSSGLQLPEIDFPKTSSPAWEFPQKIHRKLSERLPRAFASEIESFAALRQKIIGFLGSAEPELAFRAIAEFNIFTERIRFEFTQPGELTAKKLSNRFTELDKLEALADDPATRILWLSGSRQLKNDLSQYANYLESLSNHLARETKRISDELNAGQSQSVTEKRQSIQETLDALYEAVATLPKGD